MCTTPTTDINATLQQIAELTASGCDIVRVACPTQDDADALPEIARKQPDPGHRRHPLPAQVRLRGDRRRLRGGARQPGQHPQVRRPGQADRRGRQGRRRLDPDRRQRRLARPADHEKYGKATAEALVESAVWEATPVRGARLPRLQDLGQAQRPGRHGPGLRAAVRARRLAAAPRRHRGRPRVPGHDQVRRPRSAPCCPRASATRSASRCRRPPVEEVKVGNQILQSLNLRAAQARDRLLPLLRARPGRRLHAGRRRSPPGSRA